MAYLIILIIVAVVVGFLHFGTAISFNIQDVLFYIFSVFILSLILSMFAMILTMLLATNKSDNVREIPLKDVYVLGDSYVISTESGITNSLKRDSVIVDIGSKNYITYEVKELNNEVLRKYFMIGKEMNADKLSDKEFINKGKMVKLGLKANLKTKGQ